MSGNIFGGGDHRADIRWAKRGAMVSFKCDLCEETNNVLHPWGEVQRMLQGLAVANVYPHADGWKVTVQCPVPGCNQRNTYVITDHELQQVARTQQARNQRLAAMRRSG